MSNVGSDNCVVVFVKEPRAGQVKTRLARHIGARLSTELYKCLVLDTFSTLEKLGEQLKVFYYPESAAGRMRKWLGEKYSYVAQVGGDLGQRMKNAFVHSFDEGFEKVILVGSDLPDLPGEFLREALDALESNDAAIGPSSDGGYYLIGFSKAGFLPEAFEGVPWSRDRVFEQTMRILDQQGRTVFVLPQWHDVDTESDLDRLRANNQDTCFRQSKTLAFITSNRRQIESGRRAKCPRQTQ
ncbi:MAG: TIGR04282 family arsenosugar biosynthesis glycosyltransferase [Phycisphaerales bacterium]|nr:MAG: TIGR04282 family arsenosugar biosynthesis glycosyltransferase [Phycisphaerales bacterium]